MAVIRFVHAQLAFAAVLVLSGMAALGVAAVAKDGRAVRLITVRHGAAPGF